MNMLMHYLVSFYHLYIPWRAKSENRKLTRLFAYRKENIDILLIRQRSLIGG